MKSIISIIMTAVTAIASCCGAGAQEYASTDAEGFEKIISDKNVQTVDARTKAEYEQGHIRNAILIDVSKDSFKAEASEKLDKKRPVAIYCRSGRRSRTAAQILSKEGYKVTNLDGGIISWTASGKPIVK